MYEKSYTHRKNICFVGATHNTNFLITCAVDGSVKFWKKLPIGIEFVKHFCAHLGEIIFEQ
jgi:peptidylprolyl isomerase domain and WD repeat-containing protein 1